MLVAFASCAGAARQRTEQTTCRVYPSRSRRPCEGPLPRCRNQDDNLSVMPLRLFNTYSRAIEEFHPDHILIGLRESAKTGWQERGLVEKILERFGLPVTVFPT